MNKIIALTITFFIIITNLSTQVSAEAAKPNITADGAVLMDADTGQILYEKNMNSAYPPASTTKIMTALLTLEKTKLDDVVTISKDFTSKNHALLDGNTLCLTNEEQISVKDLLYGLLLRSANDAAVALAEHISGSTDNFAQLMNKRAAELGCKNTNFQNPNGLYDVNHKTSARDLALIMAELTKHPEYVQIATTATYKMAPTNKYDPVKSERDRTLWNENRLVNKNSKFYYEGCIGGKTGYTIQSSHSYVSSVSRNGQTLVVALVHDETSGFENAINLFNYGFSNFELKTMFKKGDTISTFNLDGKAIPLLSENNVYYEIPKDSKTSPTFTLTNSLPDDKAFSKGDVILNGEITLNNQKLKEVNLLSGVNYTPKKNIIPSTFSSNKNSNKYYYVGGIAIILISIFFIAIIKRRLKLKKRSRNYLS